MRLEKLGPAQDIAGILLSLHMVKHETVVFRGISGFFISQLECFWRSIRRRRELVNESERLLDSESKRSVLGAFDDFLELVRNLLPGCWELMLTGKPAKYLPDELVATMNLFNAGVISAGLSQTKPIVTEGNDFLGQLAEDYQQMVNSCDGGEKEKFANELKGLLEEMAVASRRDMLRLVIDMSDIHIQKSIGSGGFAEVFLGYRQTDGTVVAVKKLRIQSEDNQTTFEREVEILARLKHFAVLPFVGVSCDPMCIVTQFMSGGSLYARLHTQDSKASVLSPTERSIIALGIAYGMAYIHRQRIVHRDLKSPNVMLDENNLPKICDFGVACLKTMEPITLKVGTVQWMAPEVVTGSYNEKADVYSYGVILWELLTGDIPFKGMNPVQVNASVKQNTRPYIPNTCPGNLRSFIELCWTGKPEERPDFLRIVGALETGTIAFPGTDLRSFRDYVESHPNEGEIVVDQVVAHRCDPGLIAALQGEYGRTTENLTTLATELDISKELLTNKNLVSNVIDLLQQTRDQQVMAGLVSYLGDFMTDAGFNDTFMRRRGWVALLSVLVEFHKFLFPKLVDCLTVVALNCECRIFGIQHITRLAPFLLCVDLGVRLRCLRLLTTIVDRESYVNGDDIVVVVENMLRNTIPEARVDILLEIVKLYLKILRFNEVKMRLHCLMGPEAICNLLWSDYPEIIKHALQILVPLMTDTQTKCRTVITFLTVFPRLLDVMSGDESDLSMYYHIAALYLADPKIVGKFVGANSFFDALRTSLSLRPCKLPCLRLCYGLCMCDVTHLEMERLAIALCRCMLDQDNVVASLAAFSVAALLSKSKEPVVIIQDGASSFVRFLRSVLREISVATVPGLCLAGVLTNAQTAVFIDEWELQPSIVALLRVEDSGIVTAALKQIMAMSVIFPGTDGFLESMEDMFLLHESGIYGDLPIQCISNLTVMTENAEIAAKHTNVVIGIMRDRSGPVADAITILYRILAATASSDQLGDGDFFECVVKLLTMYYDDNPLSVPIMSLLVKFPIGCKAMREQNILDRIRAKIIATDIDSEIRPLLLRIRSVLSHAM